MPLHQRAEFRLALVALAGLLFAAPTHAQLRISQVGKGSGTNQNAFNGQFIELYNDGNTSVSLAGKSIQWASIAGSTGWEKFDLSGSIAPGGYWLVRLTATTAGNDLAAAFGVPFVADQNRIGFNGTFFSLVTFGNSSGKVVLSDSTALFTTSGCSAPDVAHVLDLVSWDDVASTSVCHEGSACALIPQPGAFAGGVGSTAVLRKCGGTQDTNDNLNDFLTTARPPRNSSYSGPIDAPAVSSATQVTGNSGRGVLTGFAGQTVLFTSGPSTCSGTISSVTINLAPIGGSATQPMFDDGTQGDSVTGDGIYSFRYTIPAPPNAPLATYNLVISAADSNTQVGTGLALLTVAPTPPSNDLCGNAIALPATSLPVNVSVLGNLVSAGPITTIATSCTGNGGNAGTSRDVWYSFTPIEDGNYTISTCNEVTAPGLFTSQNTVLSIHSTCPPDDTTSIVGQTLACNDEGCTTFIGGGPSTISLFSMTAGTTYLIRVAKFGSGDSVVGGPFRLDIRSEPFGACCLPNGLCITTTEPGCASASGTFGGDGTTCSNFNCPPALPPGNDDCSAATELSSGVPVNGVTYGASGSDISTCDNTSWDVWYSYTPAATGPFSVNVGLTSGSQTPAIAIFATCPPGTNANLACSGTPVTGTSNSLTFGGTSATPYLIRVATNFSQRSEFTVVVTPVCAPDFNNDSVVDFFDYLDFVDAFSSNLPAADFNNDSVIDFFDYLDFVDAFSIGC